MINLLSTERKSDIRAARTNVILSRYIAIVTVAIAFILGVLYVSHTVLMQGMATAETRIESNNIKADVFRTTRESVIALSAQLNDAKALLDQETSYARILTTLGRAMPAGTYLEALSLNSEVLSGAKPVEVVAFAKTDQDAAAIQQTLQASSLFTAVTLNGTTADSTNPEYTVKVNLTVTFNRASR